MENNLELWRKVETTNPKYTRKANVKGNNITSISPQFQVMNATEQFGSYGSKWGLKDMCIDYTLKDIGLVSFKATFFYPKGEFEIINSIQLYRDNAMTKIDDNFAKKLETDTLTKALSKLGFNADIFLGKFDDVRYFNEVTEKFKEPIKVDVWLNDKEFEACKKATKVQISNLLKKYNNKTTFTDGKVYGVSDEQRTILENLIK